MAGQSRKKRMEQSLKRDEAMETQNKAAQKTTKPQASTSKSAQTRHPDHNGGQFISDTPPKPGKTFVLIPANEGVGRDDLEFKEYARYVTNILQSKGMRRVMPVMMLSASYYIGKSSGGKRTMKLNENDPALVSIKR